jgi:hypothetical protein
MAVPTGSLTATADFLEAEADGPVNAALASFARTFAERDLLAERRRVMEARPAKS